jgi:hypothetical protein
MLRNLRQALSMRQEGPDGWLICAQRVVGMAPLSFAGN